MMKFIVTADDVRQSKPHPDPYVKAIKIANVSLDEVLVFEDSDIGMQSAESAGLTAYRVSPVRSERLNHFSSFIDMLEVVCNGK
jgi:beta-phosphoglucomutase-like phosphatase (HAD superfamily)